MTNYLAKTCSSRQQLSKLQWHCFSSFHFRWSPWVILNIQFFSLLLPNWNFATVINCKVNMVCDPLWGWDPQVENSYLRYKTPFPYLRQIPSIKKTFLTSLPPIISGCYKAGAQETDQINKALPAQGSQTGHPQTPTAKEVLARNIFTSSSCWWGLPPS